MSDVLLVDEPADGVCRLTLNRPDQLNAISHELMTRLIAELRRIDADESVRVVILRGNGRAFCAGADLSDTESLLLARVDFHSAANDDFYLWVNPDLSLGEPNTANAGASSVGLQNLTFDRISIRAGTLNGGNIGEANFDEIRIGSTLNDLLAVPEPASLMLIACGAICSALAVRRRK